MGSFQSYFESIPELETERLKLTAFTREDMNAYFDILRDPEVQRYPIIYRRISGDMDLPLKLLER